MRQARKLSCFLLFGVLCFLLGRYASSTLGWERYVGGHRAAPGASRQAIVRRAQQFSMCRAAVAGAGSVGTGAPLGASSIDWAAVGRALGKPLTKQMKGGMYAAVFTRTDLHVVAKGVPVKSELGVASEMTFMPIGGGRAYLMGELTVTEAELAAVTQALGAGGLGLTSIHKHLPAETPRIWWVHFAGYADPVRMATTVRAALRRTGTPAQEAEPRPQKLALDTKALDQLLGLKGKVVGGVYKYLVAHRGSYRDTLAHLQLSPMMQPTAALYFQPLGGSRVAINGDMMVTAEEVDRVTTVFRQQHIALVALHSHMTHEYPQLYYLHYWQTGDAATLGRALRAALDQTAVEQSELMKEQGD
ncbi:MAG: DUF1259 domain-containing protein [Hymenobacter sp.]|nr:MAG: DUF1259 domain-containing protein [Hymenobacter sp.]